ncbi:MAG: hypothetical protein ACREQP_02895, partial [Candidatus Binatia bacterium]
AWKRRDIAEARRILNCTLTFTPTTRASMSGTKTATWLRGLIPSPFMRPPQPQPRKEEARSLTELLRKSGLNVIADDAIAHVVNRLKR